MSKTFVLGLGAQKAGTTWVYKYLKASPEFAAGFTKEYHLFDTLDVEGMQWRRERVRSRALAALEPEAPESAGRALQLAAMVANPGLYYTYFAGLLARPGCSVTADLTPDYALLSAERLHGILRRFSLWGVRCVGVFLMRDPVERTVSAIRMRQRWAPGELPDDLVEAVLEWHANPAFQRRSDYRHTLAAIAEVFAPGDVHVGFYEELFTAASVERLCSVVGLVPHPPDAEQRSNAADARVTLPDDVRRVVARHHAPVYEAVAAATGRDVAALWSSARLL